MPTDEIFDDLNLREEPAAAPGRGDANCSSATCVQFCTAYCSLQPEC